MSSEGEHPGQRGEHPQPVTPRHVHDDLTGMDDIVNIENNLGKDIVWDGDDEEVA